MGMDQDSADCKVFIDRILSNILRSSSVFRMLTVDFCVSLFISLPE
jgi:hypothetical protein